MIRRILPIAALATMFQPAVAQESADYARMSRAAWAAFECSSLALDDTKEQARLFQFGYERGKTFLEAIRQQKVAPADLHSIAPSGFLSVAQGPTPDFILGRVYERAQENALKDVYTPENIGHEELHKSIAARKYGEANCQILGIKD